MVTPIPLHFIALSAAPSVRQTGQAQIAHVQFVRCLSTIRVENRMEMQRRRSEGLTYALDSRVPKNKSDCGEYLVREMEKAATLVMLQPPAPAREPTAWRHVPSQPLMRSPLSRSQTPAPPRRVSRFFRVWLPHQVALTGRSLSLLRTGKFDFANPFSRRRGSN
jgi:hypothetical protein